MSGTGDYFRYGVYWDAVVGTAGLSGDGDYWRYGIPDTDVAESTATSASEPTRFASDRIRRNVLLRR